jgi:hypothetical protein
MRRDIGPPPLRSMAAHSRSATPQQVERRRRAAASRRSPSVTDSTVTGASVAHATPHQRAVQRSPPQDVPSPAPLTGHDSWQQQQTPQPTPQPLLGGGAEEQDIVERIRAQMRDDSRRREALELSAARRDRDDGITGATSAQQFLSPESPAAQQRSPPQRHAEREDAIVGDVARLLSQLDDSNAEASRGVEARRHLMAAAKPPLPPPAATAPVVPAAPEAVATPVAPVVPPATALPPPPPQNVPPPAPKPPVSEPLAPESSAEPTPRADSPVAMSTASPAADISETVSTPIALNATLKPARPAPLTLPDASPTTASTAALPTPSVASTGDATAQSPASPASVSPKPSDKPELRVIGDWKEMFDDKKGKVYYYNKAAKKTTWKIEETPFAATESKPKPSVAAATVATVPELRVIGDWKEMVDDKKSKVYYYNKAAKKTTWKIEETPFAAAAEANNSATAAAEATKPETTPAAVVAVEKPVVVDAKPAPTPAPAPAAPARVAAPPAPAVAAPPSVAAPPTQSWQDKQAELEKAAVERRAAQETKDLAKAAADKQAELEKKEAFDNRRAELEKLMTPKKPTAPAVAAPLPPLPAPTPPKPGQLLPPVAAPAVEASPAKSEPASDVVTRGDWRRSVDSASGRLVYKHLPTKKKQWSSSGTPFADDTPTPNKPAAATPAASPSNAVASPSKTDKVVLGDWTRKYDERKAKFFYANKALKLSQWTVEGTPFDGYVESSAAAASPSRSAVGEKDGWKEVFDEKKGKPYYVEIATKRTTWKISETPFA